MVDWPDISVNFRAVADGVECTMRTNYEGVSLSVSVVRSDADQAEKAGKALLKDKVNQRRSFEQ